MSRQWYDDPTWLEAVGAYHPMKDALAGKLVVDLERVEEAIYHQPSFAFDLQKMMAAIDQDDPENDPYRGVPRLIMATLVMMHRISQGGEGYRQ